MIVSLEQINALIAHWKPRLRLAPHWAIDVTLHATAEEEEAEEHRHRPAYVFVQYGYARAMLVINGYKIEHARELERVIVHELAHAATHRAAALIASALGPRNASTAEEMGEELVELITSLALGEGAPEVATPATPAAAAPRRRRRP